MPLDLRAAGRVLRVAHRGAPALAAENTIASFRAAVEHGADLVELDVEAVEDGTLVVAHSLDLAEIAPGAGQGRAAGSLADLRRLAPALPTLDEALAFFADEAPGVGVQLDLKAAGAAAPLARSVAGHGLVGRVVVSSPDAAALRVVAAAASGLAVGLTYPEDRHGISGRPLLAPVVAGGLRLARLAAAFRIPARGAGIGASAAFLHHRVVTPLAVSRLHAAGLAVMAWTVDDPGDVQRVVRAGVDGVISNDLAMLLATLTA